MNSILQNYYYAISSVKYKLSVIISNGIDMFWHSLNRHGQKKYWEYYCDTSPKKCGKDMVNLQFSCEAGEKPYSVYIHVFNYTKGNGQQKIVSHGDIVTKKDIRDKCVTPKKFYETLCTMLDQNMEILVERVPDREKDLVNAGGMYTPRTVHGSPEETAIKTLYYHTSLALDSGYYNCIMNDPYHPMQYDPKCEKILHNNCQDLLSGIQFDENGQILGHSLILHHEYYNE